MSCDRYHENKSDDEFEDSLNGFSDEFKKPVRKYCPEYDPFRVAQLQDRTSCFFPFVWADD